MAFAHLSGGSQYAVTLTAAGGAHTKGSYTEISSATPFGSSRLWLCFGTTNADNRIFLTDLATGAAASETPVVENVPAQCGNAGATATYDCKFRVDIANGARLSARTQCGTASATIDVMVLLENESPLGIANPTTYGINTGTTRGTQIDPGGTADTKGSYTEIVELTLVRHESWAVIVGAHSDGTAAAFLGLDVATGAAASEVIIFPDLSYRGTPTGDMFFPGSRTLKFSVASGTRLSARAMCSTNTSADRIIDVALVGMAA